MLSSLVTHAAMSQSNNTASSIEASHGTAHDSILEFTALKVNPNYLELDVTFATTLDLEDPSEIVQLLKDEIQGKAAVDLQHYAETVGPTSWSEKSSNLMRSTLRLAASISTEKNVSNL